MRSISTLTRREFLRSATLAAGGLSLAGLPIVAANALTEVPATRLARLATGTNVCRWFRFPPNESSDHFSGYLPDSETAAAFHDGWYRTGDIGWLEPEGWLHITDRLKEWVKVRGFQVAPAEIEAVLHADARVRDCAVFGVPDAQLGEAIVAAVALVDGASVTAEELQAAVADQLAGYKRIRHVVFVDEIPRLPSGKALRRQLKEQRLADRP